ncbi:NUDIX hydrolase [Catenulispora subtropica]|uniref:NUDIX hydrolase n=1 Tax=Catenulispora subtropica TaxID=450798 RepID=A0ABN2R3N7_9ACTN
MSEPQSTPSHQATTPAAPPARSRSRWTVHAEWPVYENPWVDVLMADVELGDGTRFEHHVVRTREAASCVVTRRNEDRDEVLLIWRHRFAIDKWVWEIPSGLIEEGEDPAETARREVEEETGWRVAEVTPLLAFHPVGGMLRTQYRLFRAHGARYIGEPTEENEAEKVEWVPLDEVLALIDSGQIATGASLVGLLRVLAERG